MSMECVKTKCRRPCSHWNVGFQCQLSTLLQHRENQPENIQPAGRLQEHPDARSVPAGGTGSNTNPKGSPHMWTWCVCTDIQLHNCTVYRCTAGTGFDYIYSFISGWNSVPDLLKLRFCPTVNTEVLSHKNQLLTSAQTSGHYMYRQFKIQKIYVLPTQCIYVFCVDLRTNTLLIHPSTTHAV